MEKIDQPAVALPPKTLAGRWRTCLIAIFVVPLLLAVVLFMAFEIFVYSMQQESTRSRDNLRRIGLALMDYEDRYGTLPPAFITDEKGKPIHSWRVLILPFLGDEATSLYKRYRFDEPWNGLNNASLFAEIPSFYRRPSIWNSFWNAKECGCFAVVGPKTAWPGKLGIKSSEITDGGDCTYQVLQADGQGIQWTEPRDLNEADLVAWIKHVGRFALCCNGEVVWTDFDRDPDLVRSALTIDSGESLRHSTYSLYFPHGAADPKPFDELFESIRRSSTDELFAQLDGASEPLALLWCQPKDLAYDAILSELNRRGGPEVEKQLQVRYERTARAARDREKADQILTREYAASSVKSFELLTALRRVQHKPDPLEMSISVPGGRKGTVANPPVVRVTVRSNEREKITLHNEPFDRVRIEVHDAHGRTPPRNRYSGRNRSGAFALTREFKPGETESGEVRPFYDVQFLRPGRYTVTVVEHCSLPIAEMQERRHLEHLLLMRSNSVAVDVE